MYDKTDGKFPELKWEVLTRGAGSQFVMSVPHGALNFVVTEVRFFYNFKQLIDFYFIQIFFPKKKLSFLFEKIYIFC